MMQMCIGIYVYTYIYSNRSAKLPTEAVLGRRDASLDCQAFLHGLAFFGFPVFPHRGFDSSSAVSFKVITKIVFCLFLK
jgi:hypothetical protein